MRIASVVAIASGLAFESPSFAQQNQNSPFDGNYQFVEPDESGVITHVLPDQNRDAIGLLPSDVSELPRNLWATSSTRTLKALMAVQRDVLVPGALDLLYRVLLAEAAPPMDSDGSGELFLARIDKLIEFGALPPARELLNKGGVLDSQAFSRWFDISLLTNSEHQACRTLERNRWLAPSQAALVFCLVRIGKWKQAQSVLGEARAHGQLTESEAMAMELLLEPEHAVKPDTANPRYNSALEFRILLDSGFDVAEHPMPNAYAFLYQLSGPELDVRLAKGEELIQTRAIQFERILMLQSEAHQSVTFDSESGGFDLVIGGERELSSVKPEFVRDLTSLFDRARDRQLEVYVARYYAPQLARAGIDPFADEELKLLLLMAGPFPGHEVHYRGQTWQESVRSVIFDSELTDSMGDDPIVAAVRKGLEQPLGAGVLRELIRNDRIGEALLNITLRLQGYGVSNPARINESLAALREIGRSDIALEIALQTLVRLRKI